MLSARNRLRRSTDFTAVVRHGRRVGRPRMVLHLLLGDEAVPARAGLVVSKAVGSAAARNTVKRRLRHLMREKMPLLPEGSMLVVRALPSAAHAGSAVLGAELDSALRRLLSRGGAR